MAGTDGMASLRADPGEGARASRPGQRRLAALDEAA